MERGYVDRFKIEIPLYDKEVKEVYTDDALKSCPIIPLLKSALFLNVEIGG